MISATERDVVHNHFFCDGPTPSPGSKKSRRLDNKERMNCTELDLLATDVVRWMDRNDVAFWVLTSTLVLLSIVLLVNGERLVRPLCALIGGVGGSVVTFVLLSHAPCEVRLVASGFAGVLLALFALFVLKTGLFLVGAVASGGLTHLVYETLPLDPRSAWYYVAVGTGGLAGAVVSQCQRSHFVRIASSLIASGGIAAALVLVADHLGGTIPDIVLLVQVVGCTVVGTYVQHRRRKVVRAVE